MVERAISAHPWDMPTQGEILRAWRRHKKLTLEAAAENIKLAAEMFNVPPTSKKVPRTHASLTRWEQDKVEMKELGLKIIATAYGEEIDAIRKLPPTTGEPRTRDVAVPEDHADAVKAFIAALPRKAS